jgi:hypothetical protein
VAQFTETNFSNSFYRNIIQIIIKPPEWVVAPVMRRPPKRETAVRHSTGTTVRGTGALLAVLFAGIGALVAPVTVVILVAVAVLSIPASRALRTIGRPFRRTEQRRVCLPRTDICLTV